MTIPKLILFDLGGVLVELQHLHEFLGVSDDPAEIDRILHRWVTSQPNIDYDTGKISLEAYAEAMTGMFDLPMTKEQFVDTFKEVIKCKYPGVDEYLAKLSQKYTLGCLSNTNFAHWPMLQNEMKVCTYMDPDFCFASCEIQLCKPHRDIYEYVIKTSGLKGEEILFLDDNPTNVKVARKCGINAHQVKELDGVKAFMAENKLYP